MLRELTFVAVAVVLGCAACGGGGGEGGGGGCPDGSEGCHCYGNQTCDGDLVCASNVCVNLGAAGSGGGGGGGSDLVGQLSEWRTTTNLPFGGPIATNTSRAGCAFAAHGFVFHVGYIIQSGSPFQTSASIVRAEQNADGTLGAWVPATVQDRSFAAGFGVDGLQCAYADGYAYLLESDTTSQFVVQSAPVAVTGDVGDFSVAVTVPNNVAYPNPYFQSPGLLAYDGNLILSAVAVDSGQPIGFATVKGAIQGDGTVGSLNFGHDWGFIGYNDMTLPSFRGPTLGWGSFLYKVGVRDSGRVWFMDLEAGAWTDTTPLPAAPFAPRAVLWQGFVFLLGASLSDGVLTERVLVSALHADGVVAGWTETTPMPQGLFQGATLAANGYVYYLGGQDVDQFYASTVYYAKVE